MPKRLNSSRVILAGAFEVDLGSRELWRDGHQISLEERPFEVLVLLLERNGKVVTRQEIREKLWPPDSSADPERSLDLAVRRLKLALRDTGEKPGYIEILPDGGYRFVAKISKLPPRQPPGSPSFMIA